jgi:hypothetical protein
MKYYCPSVDDILNEWSEITTNVSVPEKLAKNPKSIGISIDFYLNDNEYLDENPLAKPVLDFMKNKFPKEPIYVFNPDDFYTIINFETFRHEIDAITRGFIYKNTYDGILDTGYKNIFVWEKLGGKHQSLPTIFAVDNNGKNEPEFFIKDSEQFNY